MKRVVLTISVLVAMCQLLASGCEQERPRPRQVSLAGVKIGDLVPQTETLAMPQVQFRILTYELSAGKASILEGIFDELETKTIRFANRSAFVANDFSVGLGRSEVWNKIAERLDYAGARRILTSTLVVFDNRGDEIIVRQLAAQQSIFYADEKGRLGGTTLGDGRVLWELKARPHSQQRGVAEVELQCFFRPNVRSNVGRLMGMEAAGQQSFDFSRFGAKMSGGEFLALGPSEYKADEITLSSLLFSSSQSDVVRIYLIACMRVAN
ncbi:MAG: hypothetical protein KAR47_12985 [Planctomycetes bacterium]|nr:hypothetical protein [Planctomycetota bacterium]